MPCNMYRRHCIPPDLYREAMVNDPAAIQYFKPELLTREMCHEALYSSYDLRVLRYIPYKEIHEQLLERCEGYSRTKHFLDSMNPDYMTPETGGDDLCQRAGVVFQHSRKNARTGSCAKRLCATTAHIYGWFPKYTKHRNCVWLPYAAARLPYSLSRRQ